ncbi:hypothetical protein PTSG_09171 [Salpingoeca rosetta]|uniref:Uncharacterized protein n=1 Tax=Salpingoeca rosetta (strain ATCC 50818 / BSB-021) TaxID=946362 RepID=F2UMX7_SALR5|nr:uncharacterized protein PTSG_09171 [Salpingoeca rosetta]EGD78476.1 hypothetical protein PTSG_09171 [Salpingoeca rosetta]|eukprot:XP_004989425.1 hypothetical protein PTSG_09171 [Salpingoeca rosetta]
MSVHASEWALVAEQLLVPPPITVDAQVEAAVDVDVYCVRVRRDIARTFFNLMLTCRELYHDLPWAMPKWCLYNVFADAVVCAYPSTLEKSIRETPRVVKDWIDTFQVERDALYAWYQSQDSDEATDTDAVCTDIGAWLQNRFLVHCWLGVTWDSSCSFLTAQVHDARFWHKFRQCGRLWFGVLSALEKWDESVQRHEQGQNRSDTAHGLEDACEKHEQHFKQPRADAVPSKKPQHQAEHEEEGKEEDAKGDEEEIQHKQQHQRHEHHRQYEHQQHQRCALRAAPAVFSLRTELFKQEDADLWHKLRTTTLAGVRGEYVYLTAGKANFTLIKACDITIFILSDRFDYASYDVDVRDVDQFCWSATTGHLASRCNLQRVRCIDFSAMWDTIDDLSYLAEGRLARVSLSSTFGETSDLTPVIGAEELLLDKFKCSRGQEAIAAAKILELRASPLEINTLNATHVSFRGLRTVPDVLHLPNATHIELLNNSNVKRLTCPSHITELEIDDNSPSPPLLPDFEHAGLVRFASTAAEPVVLPPEQLAALGRRVDRLILGHCVEDIRSLNAIPSHVVVFLTTRHVNAPVPPCVRLLKVHFKCDIHCSFMQHVPQLLLEQDTDDDEGEGAVTVHDLHLLSGRKLLDLMTCRVEGDITDCEHVRLSSCQGSVAMASITSLHIERATVAGLTTALHRQSREGETNRLAKSGARRNGGGDDDDGDGDDGGCGGGGDCRGDDCRGDGGADKDSGKSASTTAVDDDDNDDDDDDDDDRSAWQQQVSRSVNVSLIKDVRHCRLFGCAISDFACISNVQRLLLVDCTFDCVDSLPPFPALVLEDCWTNSLEWRWPDATFVNQSPEEMRRILLEAGLRMNGKL